MKSSQLPSSWISKQLPPSDRLQSKALASRELMSREPASDSARGNGYPLATDGTCRPRVWCQRGLRSVTVGIWVFVGAARSTSGASASRQMGRYALTSAVLRVCFGPCWKGAGLVFMTSSLSFLALLRQALLALPTEIILTRLVRFAACAGQPRWLLLGRTVCCPCL